MDLPTRTIEKLHCYLPAVVLTELSRQPLEPHQQPGRLGTQRGYQPVERGLASLVAALQNSSQNLQCGQIRLFLQNPHHLFPEIRDRARSDLSLGSLRGIIDLQHRALFRDTLYRAQRDPTQTRYLSLRMARFQQNRHFMSF